MCENEDATSPGNLNHDSTESPLETNASSPSNSSMGSSAATPFGSGNFKKKKPDIVELQLTRLNNIVEKYCENRTNTGTAPVPQNTGPEVDFANLIVKRLQSMPQEVRQKKEIELLQVLYAPY